jgi:hypothetical protein
MLARRRTRLALPLVLSLALAGVARAEAGHDRRRLGIPVAAARYWYFGETTLTGGGEPDLHLENRALRIRAMAGHRFAQTGTILAGSLSYDLVRTRRRRPGLDRAELYHQLAPRLAVMQRIRGPWSAMAFGRLGLASDYVDLSSDDLRVAAGAGVSYRFSRDAELTVGFNYSQTMLRNLVLPLVRFTLRRARYRLQILVPRGGELWYLHSPSLELGLRVEAHAVRFGLHASRDFCEQLALINVTSGGVVRWFLLRGLYASLSGGHSVRYTRLERGARGERYELDLGGWFFGVAAGYLL